MKDHLIGVISDTHGLLRPEAAGALRRSEMILHAGDIGRPEVLEQLERTAPVRAVRGNNDRGDWAAGIPETLTITAGGLKIYMLHDLKTIDVDPKAMAVDVIIAGHSHKPLVEDRDGVLYLNPGSAGPRRFKLPVTLAHLLIRSGKPEAKIVELI
jgi:uncharacterized protein